MDDDRTITKSHILKALKYTNYCLFHCVVWYKQSVNYYDNSASLVFMDYLHSLDHMLVRCHCPVCRQHSTTIPCHVYQTFTKHCFINLQSIPSGCKCIPLYVYSSISLIFLQCSITHFFTRVRIQHPCTVLKHCQGYPQYSRAVLHI